MKLLINKANVDGVTSDYPRGKARDKTVSVAGSRANVEMFGDILQFFEKMFAESGILANGLPDNVTNTFQLYLAFQKLTHPDFSTSGLTFSSGSGYSWANTGSPYYSCAYKAMPNGVELCGVAESGVSSSADTPVMTLPAAARPASTVVVSAQKQDGAGAISPVSLSIASSGVVTAIGLTATLGTYKIYFDGVIFRK